MAFLRTLPNHRANMKTENFASPLPPFSHHHSLFPRNLSGWIAISHLSPSIPPHGCFSFPAAEPVSGNLFIIYYDIQFERNAAQKHLLKKKKKNIFPMINMYLYWGELVRFREIASKNSWARQEVKLAFELALSSQEVQLRVSWIFFTCMPLWITHEFLFGSVFFFPLSPRVFWVLLF